MKNRMVLLVTTLVALAITSPSAVGQNTSIAYQGRLKVGGGTPDSQDRFDLRFRLFTAATGGSQLGENFVTNVGTESNGLFSVLVDFGSAALAPGEPRHLELGVRRTGSPDAYTPVLPRQRVVPVPTALRAQQADVAANVTGPVAFAQLPSGVARLDLTQTFTAPPSFMPASGPPFMVSDTQRVANLNADLLDGMDATAFWMRRLNGTTEVIGPNDRSNAFDFVLGTDCALRLQPGNANLGSSLVGGSANNTIAAGVPGSVVAGGRNNLINSNADYSVVAGGDGNQIAPGARDSIVGGGTSQRIGSNSINAGVFGGFANEVMANSRFAGVLLGSNGKVRENSDFAAVVSGENHAIGPNAAHSMIGGGAANSIRDGAHHSFVASGQQNLISTQAFLSAIGGGQLNQIGNGAYRSVVAGGNNNEIGPASYNAFLGGGGNNRIEFNAPYSAILGGNLNLVRSNAGWATVLGGVESAAGAPFAMAGGHGAKAEHSGSIVLADGQYANFASSNANEFAVRAAGGVRLVTGGAGLTIDGQRFTAGGAVTNTANSDTLDGFDSGDFWKITGNVGTTAGVNFLGTTDNQALELKVNNQRGFRLEPNASSPNVIGGHVGNRVGSNVHGAVIAGGGRDFLHNVVNANLGVVGGGLDNEIGSFAQFAVVGGGAGNRIQEQAGRAVISGGWENVVETNAANATIPGGMQARARHWAQFAFAGGQFDTPGDAQTSLYVLRGTTSNSVPTELMFLNGTRLILPDDSVWTFDILVVARSDGANGAGYQIRGVIKHNALGLTMLIGTPVVTTLGEQVTGWDVSVEADDVNDALAINVIGSSATMVRWVATVRTVEVIF